MYVLNFSFALRYRDDVQYSVAIPLEKVAHIDFLADPVADQVKAVIRQDEDLLTELLATSKLITASWKQTGTCSGKISRDSTSCSSSCRGLMPG